MKRPAQVKKTIFRRILSIFSPGNIFFLLFILSTFLLIQNFFGVRSKEEELGRFEAEVGALQARVEEKLGDLEYRGSEEFVYKEALEQLGYTKPGEIIVVLPDFEENRSSPSEVGALENEENSPESSAQKQPTPNWKRWRILFFGS